MSRYEPQSIETKWQSKWDSTQLHEVSIELQDKKPFYCLEMLPYPSGRIHMGHVRNYSIGDAIARYKRMSGCQVMHVLGWDAFGLPAENAAIKNKQNPATWTQANIAEMREQFKRLGFAYDWSREITTCEPDFYRWNQWFFLKMYERGVVYRALRLLNWCDDCKTTLANEQVVDGLCWRCDGPVQKREFEQWFLRITDAAQELLDALDQMPGWPDRVKTMQQHWIGRSVGATIQFQIEEDAETIEVFTTRLDTIQGCTYVALAVEHPLAKTLATGTNQEAAVAEFIQNQSLKTLQDRFSEGAEKLGVDTGRRAINPFTGEAVPIWVANFVLTDVGTGAIMSVPAHDTRDFEFAKKYDLPIKPVIRPTDGELPEVSDMETAIPDPGVVEAGGEWDGLTTEEAKKKMVEHAKAKQFGSSTVSFRLKDWGVSRQRFWGTPIPMIHCQNCGIVPVPLEDLPVVLPEVEGLTDEGSPLSRMSAFVEVECPKCGQEAKRETDTMDTFVDSAWYYFRYLDPKNTDAPFDSKKVKPWLPVDLYVGGVEHATMHLIYTRFWTKVMRDLGLVEIDEPVDNMFTQGMVIKDGAKMSKSKGNTVDPDTMVEKYGADTTRLFSLFAAPPLRDLEWNEEGVEGCSRFLARLVRQFERAKPVLEKAEPSEPSDSDTRTLELRRKTHFTIKKVTEDIWPRMHFNTAISSIMELSNKINEVLPTNSKDKLPEGAGTALYEAFRSIALLIAPFAPHLADELWSELGEAGFVIDATWPTFDPKLLETSEVLVVVQVNGKVRAKLQMPKDIDEAVAAELAKEDDNVLTNIDGKTIRKVIHVPNRLLNFVVS